ncbi:hypothetical protein POJ06DRAFT_267338 [Lipomyces tetrasporus]|uniref:Uncharacterized protein n=1 Tax=Lipomyces tetrasporus TaxID=54092 RepID=A0AAD7VTN7_9ASCO|nr:uncharacterized protein POJ06DRAFT_267338 [Lipomyces tetrasporus]KAJ8101171.1 hypothetical protein POJ06DRAFT_267338 [Lipomyces tetrasporus]
MCKHLVSFYSSPHPDRTGRYIVRPPPTFTPGLFQERLPLIQFRESDLNGIVSVSSGEDSSNCVDNEPMVQSSSNLEELESLQLLPGEYPEAKDENDE